MNHWHDEYMAEFHRDDLVKESERLRIVNMATRFKVYRPGIFAHTMFNFANWMIVTGKGLRKRYETPAVNCSHAATNSYAR